LRGSKRNDSQSFAKEISPTGEGVNHIVKRGEVQIVQAVQSLRSVQVVTNQKRFQVVPMVSLFARFQRNATDMTDGTSALREPAEVYG
jgi:hypothetical protein